MSTAAAKAEALNGGAETASDQPPARPPTDAEVAYLAARVDDITYAIASAKAVAKNAAVTATALAEGLADAKAALAAAKAAQ